VFRAIVSILKHNAVLKSVVKEENFRAWEGRSHDNMEFTFSGCPSIRITPTCGPTAYTFPTAMSGLLFLNVDMLIPGTDADDQFNLWWAIERALYPDVFAAQAANVAALQLAGAKTGLCEFSQPAFDPTPSDRFFAATGQIKIDVLLQLTG
jgi:hypothetical protein